MSLLELGVEFVLYCIGYGFEGLNLWINKFWWMESEEWGKGVLSKRNNVSVGMWVLEWMIWGRGRFSSVILLSF